MSNLELGLIPGRRWLDCQMLGEHYEYSPRSTCHEPITAGLAALGLGEAAAGGSAIAGTSLLAGTADLAATAGTGVLASTVGAGDLAAAAGVGSAAAGAGGIFGTGIGLSEIGQVAGLGGSLLQANAGLQNASYQAAVQRADAAALVQKANEDAAAGERVQITRNRQTDLAQSRIRAVGAASGTDATSPDIVNTEGLVGQQGKYNALSALYEGQAQARSDTYQSQIDLFNARRIQAGAFPAAAGTLLSGLGSFADRRLQRNYLLNRV